MKARGATVIQKQMREHILDLYPGLGLDPDYMKFFHWMYFGTVQLPEERRVIYYEYICRLLGKTSSNFSVFKFLERFQEDVYVELDVAEYKKGEKARTILPPQDGFLINLILEELCVPIENKRSPVYFTDGRPFLPARHYKMLEGEYKDYYGAMQRGSIIHDYFSNHRSSYYKKYIHQIPPIILSINNGDILGDKQIQALLSLDSLSTNILPFYRTTDSYKRIFAEGFSFQNIKREYRRRILYDTIEVDLSSAQLSIAAHLWKVKPLLDLLHSPESIWKALHHSLAKEFSETTKAQMKTAVYAVTFGGGENTILESLESFSTKEKEEFLKLPPIHALRRAQTRELKKISNAGGAMSAQGIWIPRTNAPQSVLVKAMQSYERLLIEEVYKVALDSHRDVRILSHEHDGVSLKVLKSDRVRSTLKRMQKAVRLKAKELKVEVALEVKQ
ncbi:hypothetical protein DAERI_130076 [Deinococcus aerius]|uniref:Uncharacterized protein n=1 Tax=Deinococcus aerius TaxID=200253 RepID=A0A2I9D8T0_9DEIO|nr:hypothetical protein [Deinococcus aerius]GBF07246.1 hypothetical protein DAERI_130076 [Deinococcus aerius]